MDYNNIAEEIIGLNIKEGAKIVKNYGLKFRVANSNGINLVFSTDVVSDRINVRVDNNEITEFISVG